MVSAAIKLANELACIRSPLAAFGQGGADKGAHQLPDMTGVPGWQ
jgi:hypothetical protein